MRNGKITHAAYSKLAALIDDDVNGGLTRGRVRGYALDLLGDEERGRVEASPENYVAAVEVFCAGQRDVELARVRIRPRVGHSEQPGPGVARAQACRLIGEAVAPQARTARAVALDKVAACAEK